MSEFHTNMQSFNLLGGVLPQVCRASVFLRRNLQGAHRLGASPPGAFAEDSEGGAPRSRLAALASL